MVWPGRLRYLLPVGFAGCILADNPEFTPLSDQQSSTGGAPNDDLDGDGTEDGEPTEGSTESGLVLGSSSESLGDEGSSSDSGGLAVCTTELVPFDSSTALDTWTAFGDAATPHTMSIETGALHWQLDPSVVAPKGVERTFIGSMQTLQVHVAVTPQVSEGMIPTYAQLVVYLQGADGSNLALVWRLNRLEAWSGSTSINLTNWTWVRLVDDGENIEGFVSEDGETWASTFEVRGGTLGADNVRLLIYGETTDVGPSSVETSIDQLELCYGEG